jgi:hypothetical protein
MRLSAEIDRIFDEGVFVGGNRSHHRVTVEPYWQLHTTPDAIGTSARGPYRWWQRADNSQLEIEVPNLKTIDIDRSLQQPISTCNIEIFNQWHKLNDEGVSPEDLQQLGDPGHFWFERGKNPQAEDRWDHTESLGAYRKDGVHLPDFSWKNVLIPNALLRTYQGYGGFDESGNLLPISEAVESGNLLLTGVWLVDTVTTGSTGLLSLRCRDIGRLLQEQFVFPPVAPEEHYPVHYYPAGTSQFASVWGPQHKFAKNSQTSPVHRARVPIMYHQSSVDIVAVTSAEYGGWDATPTGTISGLSLAYDSPLHRPGVAWPTVIDGLEGPRGSYSVDGNDSTFAVSIGNQYPTSPSAFDFWEYIVSPTNHSTSPPSSPTALDVDEVEITTWGGGYECYISVMSAFGTWHDGGLGNIPYDYSVYDTNADIPYVIKVNIPAFQKNQERAMKFNLPQAYNAVGVRITLAKPQDSGVGDYPYRSGIRDIKVFNSAPTSNRPIVPNVSGMAVDPFTYAMTAHPVHGYWLCDTSGNVYGYGSAFDAHLDVDYPVSGMSAVPQGNGFVAVEEDGTVHAVGDAQHYGQYVLAGFSLPGPPSQGEWQEPVLRATDIAMNYNGTGYWVSYSNGSILGFGDVELDPAPGFGTQGDGQWYGLLTPSGPELSAGVTQKVFLPGTPVVTWCEIQATSPRTGRAHWAQARATAICAHPTANGFWVTNAHGEYFAFGASKLFNDIRQHTRPEYARGHPTWGDGVTVPYGGLWQRTFNAGQGNGFVAGGVCTSVECTEDGKGIWLLFGDGHIAQFGSALGLGPVSFYNSNDPKMVVPSGIGRRYSTMPAEFLFYEALTYEIVRAPAGVATAAPGTAAWASEPKGTGFWILTGAGSVGSYNTKFWGSPSSTGMGGLRWNEGNYTDYSDIVKELLMWGGWWMYDPDPPLAEATPFGNIETTGIMSDTELKLDRWDKKPLLDGINLLRQVSNYLFYIDEEGGAHFESRNLWRAGNFDLNGNRLWVVYDIENPDGSLSPRQVFPTITKGPGGQPVYTFDPGDEAAVPYIPEVNERTNLTSYSVTADFATMRSQIIVGATQPSYWDQADPTHGYADSAGGFQIYEPPAASAPLYEEDSDITALRGINRPSMLVNRKFTNQEEQKTMIELLMLYSWFDQRTASLAAPANPCLGVNDQIRVIERQADDTYIHYIRSMRTSADIPSGKYSMALETNWLGTADNWVVMSEGESGGVYNPIDYALVSNNVLNWALRTERGAIGEALLTSLPHVIFDIDFDESAISQGEDWSCSGTMEIGAPGLSNVRLTVVHATDWLMPASINIGGSLFNLPDEGGTLELGDIVGESISYSIEITGTTSEANYGSVSLTLRFEAEGVNPVVSGSSMMVTQSDGTPLGQPGSQLSLPPLPSGTNWGGEGGVIVDDGDRTMAPVALSQLEDDITLTHEGGIFPYTSMGNRHAYAPNVTTANNPDLPYGEMIVLGDSLSALGFTLGALSGTDRWSDAVVASGAVTTQQNGAIMGRTSLPDDDPYVPTPQSTDVLVVFFGANDINTTAAVLGLDVISPSDFQSNIEWHLDNYPAERQIVMYPWRWSYSAVDGVPASEGIYQLYRNAAEAAAKNRGASFIPVGDYLEDASAYQHDGIHCNADGVTYLADLVIKELTEGLETQEPGSAVVPAGSWGAALWYQLSAEDDLTTPNVPEAMVQVLAGGFGALIAGEWVSFSYDNTQFSVSGEAWGVNRAGMLTPTEIPTGLTAPYVYGWSSTGTNGRQFGQTTTNFDGSPGLIRAFGFTAPEEVLAETATAFAWWFTVRVIGPDAATADYRFLPGLDILSSTGLTELAANDSGGFSGRARVLTDEWQTITGHTASMAQIDSFPPMFIPGYLEAGISPGTGTGTASSFHAWWYELPECEEVSVTLQVVDEPTVDDLYYWAMQIDFTDSSGDVLSGCHCGLQWMDGYPNYNAVNWGGYRNSDGSILSGSTSALPSALGNDNTRNYNWNEGTEYRFRIFKVANQGGEPVGTTRWRCTVTNLSSSVTTTIRDLYAYGDRIHGAGVWSEIFAGCSDPSVTVRWSNFEGFEYGTGTPATIDTFYLTYQVDGCTNTTTNADGMGGLVQQTNTTRANAHESLLNL